MLKLDDCLLCGIHERSECYPL